MPERNDDLHGNVPDKSSVALLLVDVINALEFDEGSVLLTHALPVARHIAALKARCRECGIPCVYANDNFGRWRSDFQAQVEHCLAAGSRGRPLVELLRPSSDDYFVLKPKHSGFYSTTLDVLFAYLEVETVILTGLAGNNCVLFTAHDAFLRDYGLFVPADCVASNSHEENQAALQQMRTLMKADIRPGEEIDLAALVSPPTVSNGYKPIQ